MNRNERVEEARKVVSTIGDCKWRLGDLALEEVNEHQGIGPAYVLGRFARDIGVDDLDGLDLTRYWVTAKVWPVEARVGGASWSVHDQLQRVARDQGVAEAKKIIEQAAALHPRGRATVDGVRTILDIPTTHKIVEMSPDIVLAPEHYRRERQVVRQVEPHKANPVFMFQFLARALARRVEESDSYRELPSKDQDAILESLAEIEDTTFSIRKAILSEVLEVVG